MAAAISRPSKRLRVKLPVLRVEACNHCQEPSALQLAPEHRWIREVHRFRECLGMQVTDLVAPEMDYSQRGKLPAISGGET